jgi:hypothetical protein
MKLREALIQRESSETGFKIIVLYLRGDNETWGCLLDCWFNDDREKVMWAETSEPLDVPQI